MTQALASRIAALLDRATVEDYRYPGGGNGFREQIAQLVGKPTEECGP